MSRRKSPEASAFPKAGRALPWACVALVGGLLAAGCGNVQLAGASVGAATGAPSDPQVQQTDPLVVEPTPAPTPVYNPPLQMGQLMAVLSSFSKPGFLGFMGTATAHVTVSNSTQMPLSGTVSVQFTDGGSPMGSPQAQQVTLDAGQSQQVDFPYKATFHFIDGASVSVTTNSPSGTLGMVGVPGMTASGGSVTGYSSAPGYAAAPGYGSTGSTYGSTGSTYGSSTGSSYGSTTGSAMPAGY